MQHLAGREFAMPASDHMTERRRLIRSQMHGRIQTTRPTVQQTLCPDAT